ncbi:839_t:CDS:2, partial [Paraglomus brasilianum]
EAVVAEIVRQIEAWNIQTRQNSVITASQGGFNFETRASTTDTRASVLRRVDGELKEMVVGCLPFEEQLGSFKGQPFTPNFVAEKVQGHLLCAKHIRPTRRWLIDPENYDIAFRITSVEKNNEDSIHKGRRCSALPVRDKNSNTKAEWSEVDGGTILLGFSLDVEDIDETISWETQEEMIKFWVYVGDLIEHISEKPYASARFTKGSGQIYYPQKLGSLCALEAAFHRPQWMFYYSEAQSIPSLFRMAAGLGESVIKNHAFLDGNKRAGHVRKRWRRV